MNLIFFINKKSPVLVSTLHDRGGEAQLFSNWPWLRWAQHQFMFCPKNKKAEYKEKNAFQV